MPVLNFRKMIHIHMIQVGAKENYSHIHLKPPGLILGGFFMRILSDQNKLDYN